MLGNRKAFGDTQSTGGRPNTCLIGCQEGDNAETMKDNLKDKNVITELILKGIKIL